MKTLRIASRKSPLALRQAELVQRRLRAACGLVSRIVPLTSAGDRLRDVPLHDFGGKGLFVRTIENALLNDEADIAVHSLKDMPVQATAGLVYACFLPRHTAEDVLILRAPQGLPPRLNKATVAALPPLRIATGSLRRKFLLQHANPTLTVEQVRGNVDTRLKALHAGKYDALVSARAALQRLQLREEHCHIFDYDWFVPSCGQGVIAVQIRAGASDWSEALAKLDCPTTRQCVEIERAIVKALGGNCALPFGCHARVDGDYIKVNALAMSAKRVARISLMVARHTDPASVAVRAVKKFSQTQLAAVLAELTF
ncbi:MAG: hydroxymethylbilane synthase [Pseudomonadota bacterium]|nr:hydroxymethylbilane synthase [Pseudomonadota bacterium]